jgi:hypothetical protein
MNNVEVGYIDIPENYFILSIEERKVITNSILETILYILEKNIPTTINKIDILKKLIESSIITNQEEENYEVCGVLKDLYNQINA